MCGYLALIVTLILLPAAFYPQRPVTQMPCMLHLESIVAAVGKEAHSQQLEVFPAEPGDLRVRVKI